MSKREPKAEVLEGQLVLPGMPEVELKEPVKELKRPVAELKAGRLMTHSSDLVAMHLRPLRPLMDKMLRGIREEQLEIRIPVIVEGLELGQLVFQKIGKKLYLQS